MRKYIYKIICKIGIHIFRLPTIDIFGNNIVFCLVCKSHFNLWQQTLNNRVRFLVNKIIIN